MNDPYNSRSTLSPRRAELRHEVAIRESDVTSKLSSQNVSLATAFGNYAEGTSAQDFPAILVADVNASIAYENRTSVFLENSTSGLVSENGAAAGSDFLNEVLLWRSAIFGIGGTAVCSIGIVCNITAIIVLAHYGTRSSAPFLLICLALSDSLFLTSMLFLEVIPSLAMGGYIGAGYKNHSFRVAYCIFYTVSFMSHLNAIYTVLTISLERYIVVVWPFLAHTLCSFRSACISMSIVVVFNVLYHIPYYLAYYRTYMTHPVTQEKVLRLDRTEFGKSYFFVHVYYKWVNCAVTFLIPFLLLVVFNSMMLYALKRDSKIAIAQHRAQKEHRLTMMVLCMTVVFFVFELLSATAFILITGMNQYQNMPAVETRISVISDLGLMLNSSINFAIYCASGKKFRETFRLVFVTYYRKLTSKLNVCESARQEDRRHRGSVISWGKISTLKSKRAGKMFAKFRGSSSQFSEKDTTCTSTGFGNDTALSKLSRDDHENAAEH